MKTRLTIFHFFISLLLVIIFCFIANYTIDPYLTSLLTIHKKAAYLTHPIPDLLLIWVVVTSIIAWLAYFLLANKSNRFTQFCYYYGILIPIAFILKTGLKFIFGRASPRDYIQGYAHPGFHWFAWNSNYSAFPSGHMLVFTTAIILFTYFYQQFRIIGYALLLLLAVALVITGYHYVSDVVAGIFVGYWLAILARIRI